MDAPLANLILNRGTISNDALAVYLYLRADIALNRTSTTKLLKEDGKLVSGEDVQSVALALDMPELTVQRLIDSLVCREWVKVAGSGCWQLGTCADFEVVWFANQAIKEKEIAKAERSGEKKTDKVRAYIEEIRKRKEAEREAKTTLSKRAKRMLASEALDGSGLNKVEKDSTQLLEHYVRCYQRLYGHEKSPFPHADTPKDRRMKAVVFIKRILTWCGEDLAQAKKVIEWAFDKWEVLRPLFKMTGPLDLAILSTKSVFMRLDEYIAKGIPTVKESRSDGVARRADIDSIAKAPEEGW